MTFCLNDLETFTKLQKLLASYKTTADKSGTMHPRVTCGVHTHLKALPSRIYLLHKPNAHSTISSHVHTGDSP